MASTKTKLATKLRTRKEIKRKVPIFRTDAWDRRAQGIKTRVRNKIEKAKKAKAMREKLSKVGMGVFQMHTERATPKFTIPRTKK